MPDEALEAFGAEGAPEPEEPVRSESKATVAGMTLRDAAATLASSCASSPRLREGSRASSGAAAETSHRQRPAGGRMMARSFIGFGE